MQKIEEALRQAVSKVGIHTVTYKDAMIINYEGIAKEMYSILNKRD